VVNILASVKVDSDAVNRKPQHDVRCKSTAATLWIDIIVAIVQTRLYYHVEKECVEVQRSGQLGNR
jgi:hypothetical protein